LTPVFLLDAGVTYLNHGAFGACPEPVMEVFQRWQRELERRPAEFLVRRAPGLLPSSARRWRPTPSAPTSTGWSSVCGMT
jgi:hypothetical protein